MATRQRKASRKEITAAEIDTRIHEMIIKFLDDPDLSTSQVLGFFRAIYAQGYIDCLKEPEGQQGKWILDLGYGVHGVDL